MGDCAKATENEPKQETLPGRISEEYSSCSTSAASTAAASAVKKTPNDFIFVRTIGEGSFATVYRAREVGTSREFAIKVCEKRLLKKEKKVPYVLREKEVMAILNKNLHPYFVRLYCTFQDEERLYFAMTLASNGEMLDYLKKLGCFDKTVTRFYAGEIILALEHLHNLGIVHRDLKPENILLSEDMHILVSDFGSSKILRNGYDDVPTPLLPAPEGSRRGSFVGTAQYVSPEVLNGQPCTASSDFWALGCIIYQMLAGLPPFRAGNDYLIFQKIMKLEYAFPEGFPPVADDLVQALLRVSSDERLGVGERGMTGLKAHPFFKDNLDSEEMSEWWRILPTTNPPAIMPYLPSTDGSEEFHSNYKAPDNLQPGLNDAQLTRLLGLNLLSVKSPRKESPEPIDHNGSQPKTLLVLSKERRQAMLEKQRSTNTYDRFVKGNLILKSGLVDKRKGLFARRRMLLLTEGPHLYYVDPVHMEYKGEIPWSKQLRPEAKNFRIYFVHTTHRTYYLEDPDGRALEWCDAIEQVRKFYLDSLPDVSAPPKK